MFRPDAKKFDFVVIVGILGNVLSTVGVVLANKYLWVQLDFKFMITLSFFHFAFTSLGTHVLLRLNFFEYKPAPLMGVLPVALGSLGSVAFMNLNLAYNSVGFYQIRFVVTT
jgi:solute carrier family 35 protein E3